MDRELEKLIIRKRLAELHKRAVAYLTKYNSTKKEISEEEELLDQLTRKRRRKKEAIN